MAEFRVYSFPAFGNYESDDAPCSGGLDRQARTATPSGCHSHRFVAYRISRCCDCLSTRSRYGNLGGGQRHVCSVYVWRELVADSEWGSSCNRVCLACLAVFTPRLSKTADLDIIRP